MIFSKFSVAFAIVGLVLVHSQEADQVGTADIFAAIDAQGKQYDIRSHCAADCPLSCKGDWRCDQGCLNEACGWDLEDCRGKYACRNCEWWKVGNGSCNQECNFNEGSCENDRGDCKPGSIDPAIYCAKDCPWNKLDDEKCDLGCHKEACKFDYQDCGRDLEVECASKCLNKQINNDVCEPECRVKGCEWDYDDCGDPFAEHCSKDCVKGLLGDKKCDYDCLNADCEYDKGDCDCAPGCSVLYERDGICQPECANPECKFDNYDCECAPGCTKAMLENDTYDSACKFDTCVLEFVKLRMVATKSYTDELNNLILELPDNVKLSIAGDGTVTEGLVSPPFDLGSGGDGTL